MKKTNKKITIEEFKMWLEGLEAFQPQNWAPNLEQWKLIRNKIFSLSASNKIGLPQEQRINAPQFAPSPSQPQRQHQAIVGAQRNPALIPIDEDIGDLELIKLPPPRIPPGVK